MFAGFNQDSRVYRLVLGIARLRGNARRALAWLDSGFIQARSLFYSAGVDDRDNVYPDTPDPLQAKMMLFMPLAFSVMFFFFPAGLVLYYVVNNMLSIAQQWYIARRFSNPVV